MRSEEEIKEKLEGITNILDVAHPDYVGNIYYELKGQREALEWVLGEE